MKYYLLLMLGMFSFLNAQGQPINFGWVKAVSGALNSVTLRMNADNKGNILTIGGFTGSPDFDPGTGVATLTMMGPAAYPDNFVLKLDSAGRFSWVKQFIKTDFHDVICDASGNIYLTGRFKDTVDLDPGTGVQKFISKGGMQGCVVKLSSSGSFLWAKHIEGAGDGSVNSLVIGVDGNIYLTGSFSQTADLDPGSGVHSVTAAGVDDCYVMKLTNSGSFVWAKTLPGPQEGVGWSIGADNNVNLYISGYFRGPADFDPGAGNVTIDGGAGSIFFLKLDNEGDYEWVKHYDQNIVSAAANVGGYTPKIAVSSGGSLYYASNFDSVCDFDTDPSVNYPLSSAGRSDAFVLKLNSAGVFQWARALGGKGHDLATAVVVDKFENVYFCGGFKDTFDFDPGPGVYKAGAGDVDVYITKLDSAGKYLWAYHTTEVNGGTGSSDWCTGLAIGPSNEVYAAGNKTSAIIDFDPSNTGGLLNNTGRHAFALKLRQPVTNGISKVLAPVAHLQVYPNPSNGAVTIRHDKYLAAGTLRIFDLSGQMVCERAWIAGQTMDIDIATNAAGIYWCELSSIDGTVARAMFSKQ